MSFQLETYVKINVSSKSEDAAVHGYPDYSLWYGRADAFEINLVIVEAKAESHASGAEAQQLAYMCEYKKKKKRKSLHFSILTFSDDHLSNGAKGEKGNGKVEHLRLRGRD